FSSRRRHTRFSRDWSSDVCSSDLPFTVNPGFSFNGYTNANGQSVSQSTYSSAGKIQPNLKPQRKISKELGLEMRFLDNRVGLDEIGRASCRERGEVLVGEDA